jgi:hypothetical protein
MAIFKVIKDGVEEIILKTHQLILTNQTGKQNHTLCNELCINKIIGCPQHLLT